MWANITFSNNYDTSVGFYLDAFLDYCTASVINAGFPEVICFNAYPGSIIITFFGPKSQVNNAIIYFTKSSTMILGSGEILYVEGKIVLLFYSPPKQFCFGILSQKFSLS